MRIVSILALTLAGLGAPVALPTPAAAGDAVRTMCVTAGGSLNLREYGYRNARRIGSVPSGACFTVIGVCDSYCYVQYRGMSGFVARRYIR